MMLPHPLLISMDYKKPSRGTGRRHVKVKHLRRGDESACKMAINKRNSALPVVALFADSPDEVTCKRCLKYIRGVGDI